MTRSHPQRDAGRCARASTAPTSSSTGADSTKANLTSGAEGARRCRGVLARAHRRLAAALLRAKIWRRSLFRAHVGRALATTLRTRYPNLGVAALAAVEAGLLAALIVVAHAAPLSTA